MHESMSIKDNTESLEVLEFDPRALPSDLLPWRPCRCCCLANCVHSCTRPPFIQIKLSPSNGSSEPHMETSLVLRPVSTLPWTTTTCSQCPGLGRCFVTSQCRAKRSLFLGPGFLTRAPTKMAKSNQRLQQYSAHCSPLFCPRVAGLKGCPIV